jgi:hypothetical protein
MGDTKDGIITVNGGIVSQFLLMEAKINTEIVDG